MRSLRDRLMNATQAVAAGFAARGVEVRYDATEAPYADVKKRVMHLMPLPEDLKEKDRQDVQGQADHELGHILFTDPRVSRKDPLEHAILNSIEDGRIEREMADRWFGIGENLEETGKRALKTLRKKAKTDDPMDIGVRTICGLSLLAKGRDMKQTISAVGKDTQPLFEYLEKCGALEGIESLETTEDAARLAAPIAKRLRESEYNPPPPPPGPSGGEGDGEGEEGEEGEDSKDSKSKKSKKPKKSKDDKKGKPKKPKKSKKSKDESEGNPEKDKKSDGEGEKSEGEAEEGDEGDESEGEGSEGEGEGEEGEGESGEGEGEESEGEGSEGAGEGDGEGDSEGSGEGDSEGSGDGYENPEDDGTTTTITNPVGGGYGASASLNLAEEASKMGIAEIRKDMVAGKKFNYPDRYTVDTSEDVYETLDADVDESSRERFHKDLKSLVPLLRRRMQMEFQAPVKVYSRRQKKGKIDGRSLWKHGMGSEKLFQRRLPRPEVHADLVLLIDISGSMGGSKVYLAAQAAAAFSQVLDLIGVRHEVLAFTTAHRHRRGNLRKGMSRTEPLHHITVKPINKSFHACSDNFVHLAEGGVGMHNNVDGEAVMWAAQRLCEFQQDGAKKALVVFSDGYPAAHCSGGGATLRGHLETTVKKIEEAGIPVAGVGIHSSAVEHFYPRNVVVEDLDNLGGDFLTLIREILRENMIQR